MPGISVRIYHSVGTGCSNLIHPATQVITKVDDSFLCIFHQCACVIIINMNEPYSKVTVDRYCVLLKGFYNIPDQYSNSFVFYNNVQNIKELDSYDDANYLVKVNGAKYVLNLKDDMSRHLSKDVYEIKTSCPASQMD